MNVPILRFMSDRPDEDKQDTHQSPVIPSRSIGLLSAGFEYGIPNIETAFLHTFAGRNEVVLIVFDDI